MPGPQVLRVPGLGCTAQGLPKAPMSRAETKTESRQGHALTIDAGRAVVPAG